MIMMIYASLWIIFTHKEHAHNTYAYKYCSCVCVCVCVLHWDFCCVFTHYIHTYMKLAVNMYK